VTSDEFRKSFRFSFHSSLGLAVYSCGVQKCAPCHSWGPAVRDHYLIHCVISGRGAFSSQGKRYELSAGDGFVVVPERIVSYSADPGDPWEYCWVGFNGSDAKRLMEQTGLLEGEPVFHLQDRAPGDILVSLCSRPADGPADEARLTAGLLEFLAALMDRFGSRTPLPPGNGYEYVQKAIRFITYHYSMEIGVSDVAASVGISRSHLYRLFMRHVSMPPNEYLIRYRVGKAASLLETGRLTVGEAAYSAGFSDQLYFSRVFRKYMGVPPSRYLSASLTRGEGENTL
jgi:AraC-like DNA-binding protein